MVREASDALRIGDSNLYATAFISDESPDVSIGTVTSLSGQSYRIYELRGSTPQYNMYRCEIARGRFGFLKVAASSAENDILEHESTILRRLEVKALELEEEHNDPTHPLNYQSFIPVFIDSFISESQGGRLLSVVGYPEVIEEFHALTPLSYYIGQGQVIDTKTAPWIIGKLLKILAFSHDAGVANNKVTTNTVLIHPDYHGVVLFDWTGATLSIREVSRMQTRDDITGAAKAVLQLMGVNEAEGEIPCDAVEAQPIVDFILELSRGTYTDALDAHRRFYDLVRSIYGKSFHPFTTFAKERD